MPLSFLNLSRLIVKASDVFPKMFVRLILTDLQISPDPPISCLADVMTVSLEPTASHHRPSLPACSLTLSLRTRCWLRGRR